MQSGERERAGSSQQGVESNNQESSDWTIESWPGIRQRIARGREDDEASGCGGRQTIGLAG